MLHPYYSLPDPAGIQSGLGLQAEAFAVEVVRECSSTNSVLMTHTPPDDGRVHVLVALSQTAGRGRRGRAWQSWPGSSALFSSLWRFDPGAPVPAGLSLVAGVAVARVLERLGVTGVQLKWPNDILVLGHKLVGILVELLPGRGRTPAAVVGIGINLATPPDAAAVSETGLTALSEHLPVVPDAGVLIGQVLAELQTAFGDYARGGFVALREEWQQRNAHAGLPVKITGEGIALQGICAGVDRDGALLLEVRPGELQRILSGEVSLRPAQ